MKGSWMAAALLGSILAVGCGDRTGDEAQNLQQNVPVEPAEPTGSTDLALPVEGAPQGREPSPTVDGSVVATPRRGDAADARPTSGDRLAAPRPAPGAGRRPAPSDAPPAAPRWREVTLPAGTALPVELLTPLSSETAQVETPVRARARQAITIDGYTAIPAGAVLTGDVIDVARAGRVQGRSRLAFRFTEVEVDGGRADLRTNPITFEGEETKGEDATRIGAGAVGGAIVGGIIGGGSGAAKGAAIGGAAGTGVVLATRGREVTLGAGTNLAATLATPFTVRAPVR